MKTRRTSEATPRGWALIACVLLSVSAGAPASVVGQSTIDWAPCEAAEPGTGTTECAGVEMPIDHARPDGETMTIGIRRRLGSPSNPTPARQLWLLPGGPGDAVGGALDRLAAIFADSTLDLYGIDHRGTGASGHLLCPVEQAPSSQEGTEIATEEWAGCIEHIQTSRPDLEYLTVTQSAMDLGRAIEATRPEGGSVFVLGISYGSFWANRYLHLFPEQPSGVILDGIVPADWTFAEFDRGLDLTGRRWLDRCAEDAECRARLGEDPAATVLATLSRLDDGHCPTSGLDAATARLVLGVVLMVDAVPNALIPALAHRLDRCAWSDVVAILQLFRDVFSGIGESSSHSPALQRHVALSELWNATDPGPEALDRAIAEAVLTTDVSASFAKTYEPWPTYAADTLDGLQAPYEGPLLLLHGGLDPTMPSERLERLVERFDGEHQTFALIPEAGHVVLNYSECARTLYAGFLADPTADPDLGCVGDERFVDFAVEPAVVERLLGTPDLWGDDVSTGESIWFHARYRWSTLLLTGGWLVAWVRLAAKRRRSGRPPAPLRRVGISVVAVASLTLGVYTVTASIPLLTDYRSWTATLGAAGVVAIQALAAYGLGRWSRLGRL